MTELTPIESAVFVIAAMGFALTALGFATKRYRDRLTRLIEQEEAELARRPAE